MASSRQIPLVDLLAQISACTYCEAHLPLGSNPVVRAHEKARIMIIGQAPGAKVHATSVPWNDPSGDRLRNWLGVEREVFYDASKFAIMPMGFCYPGKGKSGDLPPRKECAPKWHNTLLEYLPNIELTLLIGSYAQKYYLKDNYATLTSRVKKWKEFLPRYLPLVHPSPRNRYWLTNNPWFEEDLLPVLKRRVANLL